MLSGHLRHEWKRGCGHHNNFRDPLFLRHKVFLPAAGVVGCEYLVEFQKCLYYGGCGVEMHASDLAHGWYTRFDAAAVYLSGAPVLYHNFVRV